MNHRSTVFSMMVIGVMLLTLLKTPLTTASAAGKPPAKTRTPGGHSRTELATYLVIE